jgi:hypothetical protein
MNTAVFLLIEMEDYEKKLGKGKNTGIQIKYGLAA